MERRSSALLHETPISQSLKTALRETKGFPPVTPCIRPYLIPANNTEYSANTPSITTPPTYPTGMGDLTFEELYRRTSRITGYVMRDKLGMTNPDDIDDCMQAGYFKVWQLLQKQPTLFANKPKRYIVQAVVFRSKVQRFSHQRHYRKIVYDAQTEVTPDPGPVIIRRLDTWIDLEQALTVVGEHVASFDSSLYLLALYALITQVTTQDVVQICSCGRSTLNKAKRRIRSTLAQELPGYGHSSDPSRALNISQTSPSRRPAPKRIAPLLFDDEPSSTPL